MTSKSPALIALGAALLLGCTGYSDAQPIIYEGYRTSIFVQPGSNNGQSYDDPDNKIVCYHKTLESLQGAPTTTQYLAMFSDKFVEDNGRVFTVKNHGYRGGFPLTTAELHEATKKGLYEVRDIADVGSSSACVQYHLIYENDNIGQIVASGPKFDPIRIIGVDRINNKIYGYYPIPNLSEWGRKSTVWGDALDGSLVAEPVEDGEAPSVSGVSLNSKMFNLYGSFDNFNFSSKGDIKCAGRPAIIGDWSGKFAKSRGTYCPGKGNNQLKKYTWHSSGRTTENMNWAPASKIARLGPKSNIFGVATNGNLLALWNDNGIMRSTSLNLSPLEEVRAVGGLDDAWARGVFVSNGYNRVYNVYWEGGPIKAKEIPIDYYGGVLDDRLVTLFFGNHGGKTYLLYGWIETDGAWSHVDHTYLYRLNYVGGNDRYEVELLSAVVYDPSL